jgi:hypothetical protein
MITLVHAIKHVVLTHDSAAAIHSQLSGQRFIGVISGSITQTAYNGTDEPALQISLTTCPSV